MSDFPDKYPLPLRALHWLMALCILALFALGMIMVDLDKQDPMRAALFGVHKSLGVLVLLLFIARLAVRWRMAMPEPAPGFVAWERTLAHWAHRGLYVFMAVTPLIGWAYSDLHGRGVKLFGIAMPKLFPTVEGIGRWPGELHGYLAYALLGLVVLHIAAIIKHRYLDRSCVLKRML